MTESLTGQTRVFRRTGQSRYFDARGAKPSVNEMLANLTEDLQWDLGFAMDEAEEARKELGTLSAGRSEDRRQALKNKIIRPDATRLKLKTIRNIAMQRPAGFKLDVVRCQKIDQKQEVKKGYRKSSKRFKKFLAKNNPSALSKLGICDHGIACMAKGYAPRTAAGGLYTVSVDHKREIGFCGTEGYERRPDPLDNDHLSYIVNFFANRILLPDSLHEIKNILHQAQGLDVLRPGDQCWGLTLLPKDPGMFVYVPSSKDRYKFSIQPRNAPSGKKTLRL